MNDPRLIDWSPWAGPSLEKFRPVVATWRAMTGAPVRIPEERSWITYRLCPLSWSLGGSTGEWERNHWRSL